MKNKMALHIGVIQEKIPVCISKKSPNEHLALFGISGSGKSTRISKIVESACEVGKTVIALDLSGQDYRNLSTEVYRISVKQDGLNLKILDLETVAAGAETYVNFVAYIVDILSSVFQLGVRQAGVLREAVEYAVENKEYYSSEMEALIDGLNKQDSNISQVVLNKMWQILQGEIFRESKKQLQKGQVNVIDFQGINPSAQREAAEIVLASIWKKIKFRNGANEPICLVIDEFQHFVKNKNTVLMEMIRESRKYGVNLILATQSMCDLSQNVKMVVAQMAVQLYFRSSISDVKKIAEMIAPDNSNFWRQKLKALAVGESIAMGNMSINDKEMAGPIIVSTDGFTNHQNRNSALEMKRKYE